VDELVCRIGVAEVPGGGSWATKLDAALPAIAELDTAQVHDPDPMARDRSLGRQAAVSVAR
jgi:hypothetical protein